MDSLTETLLAAYDLARPTDGHTHHIDPDAGYDLCDTGECDCDAMPEDVTDDMYDPY